MQTKVKVKKKKKRTKAVETDSTKATTFTNSNQSAQTSNTPLDDTECTIQMLDDTLSIIQYGTKKIFLIGTHHEHLTSAQVTKLHHVYGSTVYQSFP